MNTDYKKGYYRNIPVYVRRFESEYDDLEIVGRNWFYDILADFMLFWDTEILMVDYYQIWIEIDGE